MNRTASSLKVFALAVALFSLLTLSAGVAYGQAISGNVVGTVVDSTGAAVANADVSATNLGTAVVTSTNTGGTGSYRFDNLPVGAYTITVKASGFRATVVQVEVLLNHTGTVNATLTPGATNETVEVSGVAPTVDTSTAQLGTTYTDLYSQNLGITGTGGQGAGVLNLSLLNPGVTNANALGDGAGPSVGGQRPRDNNFTVEGVDNNNKTVTGPLATVPNDAVDNFSLLQNQFNAEFGHSSGGQFNTTIKSGTNSFHGSLYEYFRNRDLNAVDATFVQQGLTSNPRLDSNRFGGTFGGPIIKNKLFFFSNFEYQPVGLTGATPGTVATPTAAGLAAIATDPQLSATNFAIFKQFVPVPGAGSSCGTFDGTSNGIKFGKGFNTPANGSCPAGKVELGSISIVPPAFINYKNFVQSADFNISGKDQLRARYVYNDQSGPDIQAQLPVFYVNVPIQFRLFTLGYYHTFTPSILNELRVGFNRFSENFPVGGQTYPGLDAFPNIFLNDLGAGLNIGPDPNAPQGTVQNYYGIVDNLSWTKGKHTFKLGMEYREYISPQTFTQRSRGDYEYNSTQLFLEDFSPDIIGQRSSGSTTYYGNQNAIYWYVDDTWRMTSHLTLSLGLRYEYTTIPLGEQRQSLNKVADTPSVIIPQVGSPLIFDAPRAPKNDFAPRIGIAYSPGTSGNTSIRAGFGMAYDTLYDNIGILAVPPQIGATNNEQTAVPVPNFLGAGGLSGGGSGITILNRADAIAATSSWIPPNVKYPYSINWNLGVQHSFGKNYTAEVNYVGTRGNRLDVQNILNLQSPVTPANALPLFYSQPSQATLDGLTSTLANLENANPIPANLNNAGFNNSLLTGFIPTGWSTYHGLQTQLTRRFSNGLTFQAAYTYSHTIDNSTADFHSTDLTPRRQQDFFNSNVEKATSALSRTHRFTLAAVYELPFFKSGNWLMRNVAGNWQFSPVYTYESPEFATVQAARDANLNIDTAGDRGFLNTAGVRGTGGDVQALNNTGGDVVAYLATSPAGTPCGSAAQCPQFIRTGLGMLSNLGRNTLPTDNTNNIDLAVYKNLNLTERFKFTFGAQFGNIINHPQYLPGSNPGVGLGVNDVLGINTFGGAYKSYVTPGKDNFNVPKLTFPSNARTIGLVVKFIF
jgi:hypothetical protein